MTSQYYSHLVSYLDAERDGDDSSTIYFNDGDYTATTYLSDVDDSSTTLYIDDVLSINNPTFADYLSSIYPSELEVKETSETNNSASYLDIMLSYDIDGHMITALYDKRDDFNFSITNFPFLSSNIPSSPAYGVFMFQLIRYARASTKYTDFVLRARRLSDKLLSQGYVCDRLTSSLGKFYGRYGNSSYTMMSHSPEWWMIFCHRPFEPSNQKLYSMSSEMEVTGCMASQPVSERLCEPCEKAKKDVKARTLCYECHVLLCEPCSDYHQRLKSTKDHNLIELINFIKKSASKNESSTSNPTSSSVNEDELASDYLENVILREDTILYHGAQVATESTSEKHTSFNTS
ncbi:hypothetical protein FSP39_008926 [Pinctada imbricata]|uniref:B box-type domain-containing protein n=1 Tax=Pinctada imbricata TaxID=66713 RepID=A0AA88YNI4_PINIB|nr:hypothetical protein FSP39_008926 [Pinctada imbricata]